MTRMQQHSSGSVTSGAGPPTPVLELRGISKRFPGVVALNDVAFDLRAGEVHVLVGENGAGKSTLVKLLSGIYQPDAGTILLDGQPVVLRDPHAAQQLGISTVHQELNLVPHLDVGRNIFLGREPLRGPGGLDRKSTRLNSSHANISYAVFCLKKKAEKERTR